MGKLFIWMGVGLIVAGLLISYAPGAFSWFGRLPGDIRIEGEKGGFYFPLVSLILLSVVASIIVNLVRRWLH